jgi:hypothetical protein
VTPTPFPRSAAARGHHRPWLLLALAGLCPLALAPAVHAQPLPAHQRLLGTMEVNAGRGVVPMRSLATTEDPEAGKKLAARLEGPQGERDLAAARNQVGGKAAQNLSKEELLATVNAFAGKTFYDSEARLFAPTKTYHVTLKATAADGSSTQLSLRLNQADLRYTEGSVSYRPPGARITDEFTTPRRNAGPAMVVKLDKVERVGGKSLALSGSFQAGPLQPSVLAKNLQGQTLPQISGRFTFTEVPLR